MSCICGHEVEWHDDQGCNADLEPTDRQPSGPLMCACLTYEEDEPW